MLNFKFFQKKLTLSSNEYCGFDMDLCLINILKYKQLHHISVIGFDTDFSCINVPINGFVRILDLKYFNQSHPNIPERIEIDYRVIEYNTGPINFTFKMPSLELLRLLETNV